MAKNSALGKGLGALLPSEDEGGSENESAPGDGSGRQVYELEDGTRLLGRVAEIDIGRIRPNPYQPRQEFNDASLDELAHSIQELGIIQPITVRALGNGQFEIISGERRLRAARRAGLQYLPAFIRQADSEEMLEMALVENVQREELNPIEVALGYQRLLEECGLTQEEVAQKVSKSRATVANFLRLLRLPPRIQAALRDKEVAMGHARALVSIDDTEAQVRLLQQTIEEDLSVRSVEKLAREWHQAQEEPEDEAGAEEEAPMTGAPDRDALEVEALRGKLRSRFSTQVNIRHKGDGEGRIELSYYSVEDLERLMDLLLE